MVGKATIIKRDDGAFDYREQGRLTPVGGQPLDAARRYIFVEEIGGFAVLFAETPPRLFHHVTLEKTTSGLAGVGKHLCGDDRYDSRYAFSSRGSFVIAHAVRGPHKAYAMETRYVRAAFI